ncbi:MAG: hypothetical protein IKE10_01620 [Bacilli bacterium]|nr:hypothetical protein [Bacilli bacterium]
MYQFPKDRYHDMDKQRTLSLISTSDIDIPIERSDYSYFVANKTFLSLIRKFEDEVCDIYTECELKERFRKKLRLHILPNYSKESSHSENYCLVYSPKEIIDNIFDILDIDAKTLIGKHIDYNSSLEEYYEAEKHVKNVLSSVIGYLDTNKTMLEYEVSTVTSDSMYFQLQNRIDIIEEKLKFARMSLDGLDKIFTLYRDRRLTDVKYYDGKDSYIVWRNLAQYIAITSLRKYEKTGNLDYLEYPYKFYEKCSKPTPEGYQMKYVSSLLLEDDKLDSTFVRYNGLCGETFTKKPEIVEFLLNHKDNDKTKVFETIKPSKEMLSSDDFGSYLELKTKDYFSRVGKLSVEDLNTQKQLMSKIKFYAYNEDFNSHLKTRIFSSDNETGVVGFVLDNDYIVLEKFFDEDKNGYSIPSKDSAIYILPLDMYYYSFDCDSLKVRKHKRDYPEDIRIQRKYHKYGDLYQDAVLDIFKYGSISSLSADDFIKLRKQNLVSIVDSKNLKKKPNKKD